MGTYQNYAVVKKFKNLSAKKISLHTSTPVRAKIVITLLYNGFLCDTRCSCGHLVTQHASVQPWPTENLLVQVDCQEKWTVPKHTQAFTTDAYGTIEFQGSGLVNKAMVQKCSIRIFTLVFDQYYNEVQLF